MSELVIDYIYPITVFTAIFAIVDPMGNIPIFYTLTHRFTREERLRIAKRAIIAAMITLVVFGTWTVVNAYGCKLNEKIGL